MAMRAAIYLRVSSAEQTTGNQKDQLQIVASQRAGRSSRPMKTKASVGPKEENTAPVWTPYLKDATRGKFQVVMAWAVDRLGRSLINLID
jgi:DNA invertase Pin-like site-specific DNA recombinase